MSTRRDLRNMKRGDTVATTASPIFRESRHSEVIVLAIEQALAELGIHGKLSDIVAKAQSIETAIMQSRSCRKREHLC